MAENRGMLADGNQPNDLANAVLRRLAARLADILANRRTVGQQIVIHIPPNGAAVRIEWPSEIDEIRHGSKSALPSSGRTL
jgi:hypothetical protein